MGQSEACWNVLEKTGEARAWRTFRRAWGTLIDTVAMNLVKLVKIIPS